MASTATSTEITFTVSIYRGWVVTIAAALTGLLFGILYIWSIVRAGIPPSWGWTKADMALPYSTMCAFFAITMVPAGRLQDRFGPRIAILLGGLLAGLGLVVSGLAGSSLAGYLIGFGVLTGCGVGFGYAATTPASIKWFPPQRTGLIAGVVVAGFGLAPVLLAPLAAWLLDLFATAGAGGAVEQGVPGTMITLGVLTWIVVGLLALFVKNPPEGHLVQPPSAAGAAAAHSARPEYLWKDMLRTPQFWVLFGMYFLGAAAGLTFVSVASDLGKHALGSLAFLAVVVLAVGNASGRVLSGTVSDRIGRQWTLLTEFVWQGLVVAALFKLEGGDAGWAPILAVVFMLGFNYGTNLAVFPAVCKDYFGLRNFGFNYGFLFAAFGSAGLVMPWVNGVIEDRTGSSDLSYAIIIGMLVGAAVLALVSKALGQPGERRGGALARDESPVGEGSAR
jgi:MFS transporter, OFA family, oxalate/formate antiporter